MANEQVERVRKLLVDDVNTGLDRVRDGKCTAEDVRDWLHLMLDLYLTGGGPSKSIEWPEGWVDPKTGKPWRSREREKGETMDRMRMQALKVLVQHLLIGPNNLIGTDFADIEVRSVERDFVQPSDGGYRVSFTVSKHAFGKVHDSKTGEALQALLKEESEG